MRKLHAKSKERERIPGDSSKWKYQRAALDKIQRNDDGSKPWILSKPMDTGTS